RCHDPLFDLVDDAARLADPAVDHEPARAFRDEAAQKQNGEPEHRAGPEGRSPAPVGRQKIRIEKHERAGGAERRADPEAAVDDDVGPAAVARRDEFLDRRVDRGALAADAGAGQEAEQSEAPEIPGQRRGGGGDEVEAERDVEEPLTAPAVGQPSEEHGTGDGAEQIGAGGLPHLRRAKLERRALLQRAGDGSGERDLESVEYPGDAKGDDDEPMERAPRQAVEPRRDVRLDEPNCWRLACWLIAHHRPLHAIEGLTPRRAICITELRSRPDALASPIRIRHIMRAMDLPIETDLLPARFRAWFTRHGWRPHAHQLAMLAVARAGRSALLVAPTGGGKTLAGFLPSLVELSEGPAEGLHTLYISPLKALAVDIHRNLETPIVELVLPIRAETRTGDTPAGKRQRQRENPPQMLMTTPESLALLLSYDDAGTLFGGLRAVIIDELHALVGSKRGDLLALGLARLARLAPQARRTGLSATVAWPDELAAYLTPDGTPVARIVGALGPQPEVAVLVTDEHLP